MQPSISIFFPAYNDAGTIATMVIAAEMTVRRFTGDYEIIVINDGSRDYTGELLDELAGRVERLRVIHHSAPSGYGGVLRAGFAHATKDWIFYTDGDAQYDPRELALLIPLLTPEVDLVNGYKIGRGDRWYRKIIGRLYHWGVKTAFGLRLRDVDCDFRLMRRSIFDVVELTRSSGVICVEMMKKIQDAGFVIAEVPVHHYHRSYGSSQFFNVPRVARTLLDLTALWRELVLEHGQQKHKRDLPQQPRVAGDVT